MTTTVFRATGTFIPFDAMSDADQIEHLMSVHGFDHLYGYEHEDGTAMDRDEVAELHRSRGRDGRIEYHAEDHAESPDLAWTHTHDKLTRR